jgi:hypothetical protein
MLMAQGQDATETDASGREAATYMSTSMRDLKVVQSGELASAKCDPEEFSHPRTSGTPSPLVIASSGQIRVHRHEIVE